MSPETLEKRFTDLQDRLAALQDATNQLEELIDRLANFDFQPGSVPLGAGDNDDNVVAELGAEINQVLREQEEELELLREEIVDIRPAKKPGGELQHDKDRLRDGADRLGQELQSCRKAFRRAQISAKRNLELVQRQERELLYASFSNPRSGASSPMIPDGASAASNGSASLLPGRRKTRPRSEMSKEEQMLHASSDVTQSMRRTHDLMAAELSKSDFAHSALRESTAALSQLSESYSSLDAMLSSSRALLGTLLKSQKTDTWYLQSAFYLLVVTLCWLVFRRLLWGPTWWLIWLPLKLIFRTTYTVSSAVVRRRGSQGVESGSEAVSAQPTVSQQVHMNNEGVPTAQVSLEPEKPRESSDSVMEEVSKIVNGPAEETPGTAAAEEPPEASEGEEPQEAGRREGEAEGETILRERRDDEPPNPKKRMMEEDPSARQQPRDDSGSSGHERPRDEL
ncbi:Sec20-domain-containing protein [Hypoxylon sp. FL1150]|nr:Sec20-domain-containing protein [Hypoxylon sp. FL1150]